MNVMGGVMAYFKVAFRRYGDSVPMAIDRLLLRKFATSMRETLISQLKLFESDQKDLGRLFHEDDHIIETRYLYNYAYIYIYIYIPVYIY